MAGLETQTGKLTNEVVTAGVEGDLGFLEDVVVFESRLLGSRGEGVKGFDRETKFDSSKGDNDVELFFHDFVFFDEAFDVGAIFDDLLFDFLRADGFELGVEAFDVVTYIFSGGAKKNLDGEGE